MEWISVKDDLPLFNTDVLVYDESGDILVAYRKNFYGIWHWVDSYGFDTVDEILYWMPLPEPPKVK